MNDIGQHIYEGIEAAASIEVAGWNSTNPAFAQIIGEIKPQTIVEVGTWLGASAIHMAQRCADIGITPRIYCVDTWLGAAEFWTTQADTQDRDLRLKNGYPQVYWEFLSNVVRHNLTDIITPVPNTSAIGCQILKHKGVVPDLIYIDGSHDVEDVRADIRCYREILRPGGIMFGDDFDWIGVKSAVCAEIESVETSGPFWIWRS